MFQEFVTPSQVFEAIRYAQEKYPDDKHGDKAFQLNLKNIRPGNNNTRYLNFEILKKKSNNNWEYVPLNLKFMKLNTISRILPPDHEKRKYPGVQLQFDSNSSFESKKIINEKEVIIVEEYGRAKIAIAEAFKRIVESELKAKRLFVANPKISIPVQFDRVVDSVTGQREPLEKPILRMEIKFEESSKEVIIDPKNKKNASNKNDKIIDPNARPKCTIYDANKKIDKNDPDYREGELNFAPLKYDKDGKVENITYKNIGEVILIGSTVSGIDSMSSVVISTMGISLPSKASLLVVSPSRGSGLYLSKIFDATDFQMNEEHNTDVTKNNNTNDNIKNSLKEEFDDSVETNDEFD